MIFYRKSGYLHRYLYDYEHIRKILIDNLQIHFPLIVKLESYNESRLIIHEYIVLDTISNSISRNNDIGPWVKTESNTLGSTNEIIQNNYDSELVPQLFVLYQNYPNPFNGQTRITFDLLDDGIITLYVTDATGRIHDKIIEEEFFNSGIYNYLWSGENRSSGVYFITLQAEIKQLPPAILSRKMIYLK